jgi:hypothetical protein
MLNRIFVLYIKSLLVDVRLHVPRKRRPVAHDSSTQTPLPRVPAFRRIKKPLPEARGFKLRNYKQANKPAAV